jgi:hypothetical protein
MRALLGPQYSAVQQPVEEGAPAAAAPQPTSTLLFEGANIPGKRASLETAVLWMLLKRGDVLACDTRVFRQPVLTVGS